MSLLQNAFALLSVILICLNFCSVSFAAPTETAELSKADNNVYIMIVILQPYDGVQNKRDGGTLNRMKRDSGSGKFSDSATMTQTKVMQLYLQMFKNTVSKAPIGGSHPMHVHSVAPVVKLFKQRIIAFFFPEVGDEKV